MNHTSKMVVVPHDAWLAKQQKQEPIEKQLTNLDQQMHSVLNNNDVPSDQKYSQYEQILRRHRYLDLQKQKPTPVTIEDPGDTLGKRFTSLVKEVLEGLQQQQQPAPPSIIESESEPASPAIGVRRSLWPSDEEKLAQQPEDDDLYFSPKGASAAPLESDPLISWEEDTYKAVRPKRTRTKPERLGNWVEHH